MYYINGNHEKFDVPVYLKEYYDSLDMLSYGESSLLTREQCLDAICFLVGVDYHLEHSALYLDNENFKGIGFFGDTEVAFFGDKYGPTKSAITFDEFKKYNLSNDDISNITKDLIRFFQGSVRYREKKLKEVKDEIR